jgi:hypothetical protein
MTKFVDAMEVLFARYRFVVDGFGIERVSADDATGSFFFWPENTAYPAFQFKRDAFTDANEADWEDGKVLVQDVFGVQLHVRAFTEETCTAIREIAHEAFEYD